MFSQLYFSYFLCMPHLFHAALIYPMPVPPSLGKNSKEIKVCLVCKALCAAILQGGFFSFPRFGFCVCWKHYKIFQFNQHGRLDFRDSLNTMSLDILRAEMKKWGFVIDWKTFPREFCYRPTVRMEGLSLAQAFRAFLSTTWQRRWIY